MKLSIIIPAHNEAEAVSTTVATLYDHMIEESVDHEIIVVNDNSTDDTGVVLDGLRGRLDSLRIVKSQDPPGFGFAVRQGLSCMNGDAVALYMADGSDSPKDLVRYLRKMEESGTDCVFGTRFGQGAKVYGYPWPKLFLNRFANNFIRVVFGLGYNDVTNAFKLYRKDVIAGVQPILSYHFNITVELPLKAIVRGYSYEVISSDWVNRKSGESKLRINEMGSRYLFIILYCFIEKWLSKGDYKSCNQRKERW